jgi:replication factor C small subunit
MLDLKAIWVEKYRPQTLDDIILSERNKDIVKGFVEEIPNLLFVGTPGTGKTTLAKIIVNDILKCNFLYINASDESGIDTIRHKVTNFSHTKSLRS